MAYKLFIFVVVVLIVALIYISMYNKLLSNLYQDKYLKFIPEGEVSLFKKKGNIFTFVLESNLCSTNTSLLMLIIITSYVGHIELRSAHRRAYSQEYLDTIGIKRIFLLAKLPASEREITQAYIDNEQERFGDLLQGNFKENYRNLPYKHLMGLHWAHSNCNNTKYILKADDDTVFNLHEVLSVLRKKLNYINDRNFLLGSILKRQKPIRTTANKWFVSQSEYDKAQYPPYLSGSFYITTPSTARAVVQMSHLHSIFWIDDVYVTGILANAAGVNLTDGGPNFILFEYEQFKCCLEDMIEKSIHCDYISGPNGGDNNLIVKFTDALNKCFNCRVYPKPISRLVKILQKDIENEERLFGDLLQGNFVEDYRNLSYKHLMGLKWAYFNCNTKYILKVDDDTVFNLNGIITILQKYAHYKDEQLLLGHILNGRKPIRRESNKWFVTQSEYKKDYYPPFLSGWMYITTPSVAQKLVEMSFQQSVFWIDDVYVTGILASNIGLTLIDGGPQFLLSYYEQLMCCLKDMIVKHIRCDYLGGPNGGDTNLIVKFVDAQRKCIKCKMRSVEQPLEETCVFEKEKNPLKTGSSEIGSIHL